MAKQLNDLFFEHDSKRVDKWEQYLGMYQSELATFVERGAPVRLLEIGVQNGGSLELWSKYLPAGSVVRGIDIDEKVGKLTFEGADIVAFVGDATDGSTVERLFGNARFDIIIDDGSHCSSDVIASFRLLYPHLSHGGKYIIEDLHCSYFASHEGGFRASHSSIEWLKRLIDVLNADHIDAGSDVPPMERELMAEFRTSLARIAFYDSVGVVEKLPADKAGPYRRVLSGQQTHVLPEQQWVPPRAITVFKPMLFGQAAARHLEAKLISTFSCVARELEETRHQLSQAIAERDARITELANLTLELEAARRKRQDLLNELASIRRSWCFQMQRKALALRGRIAAARRRFRRGRGA